MSSSTWDSPYPRPWCAWQWSDKNNIYGRAREIAPDDYEWEYSHYLPIDGSQAAISESTPRNREADPSPSDLQESYDEVSDMADQFRNTSLENSTSSGSRSKHRRLSNASGSSSVSAPVAPSRSKTPIVQFSGPNATPIVTRNKNETHERNNPNFKVHDSKHFVFGKVFKVLWSEPVGSGGTVITTLNQAGFQKTRRFMVIDKRRGHSICLPILTYGGRATLKSGAHGEDHAAVYCNQQTKRGPTMLEGENMRKKPIKIDIRLPSEKLDPLSRLNYAKVYTVEHNVKVNFIGEVNRRYEQLVVLDYNATHGPIADKYRESPGEMQAPAEDGRDSETRNAEDANSTFQTDFGAEAAAHYGSQMLEPTQFRSHGAVNSSIPVQNLGIMTHDQTPVEDEGGSGGAVASGVGPASTSTLRSPRDSPLARSTQRRSCHASSTLVDDTNERDSNPVVHKDETQPQRSFRIENGTSAPSTENIDSVARRDDRRTQSPRTTMSVKTLHPDLQATPSSGTPLDTMSSSRFQKSGVDNIFPKKNQSHDGEEEYLGRESNTDFAEGLRQEDTVAGVKAENASLHPMMISQVEGNLAWLETPQSVETLNCESTVTRSISRSSKSVVDTWLGISPDGDASSETRVAAHMHTNHTTRSRNSSVESLESHILSSAASVSSCSSLASQNDGAERLVALLLMDEQLKSLYTVAARKVSAERFQENFRRCLYQCSVHLKAEARPGTTTSRAQTLQCARAVRLYSRQAAATVRSTLEAKGTLAEAKDGPDSYSLHSDGLDSDDELPDMTLTSPLPNKTTKDKADGLETVLMSSVAFQMLRENFALFLHPDPIKKALFVLWPITHPRTTALEIQYHVSWLLPSFIKSGFPAGQELKNVLTLSGQISNAQAQNCEEYVAAVWPEFGDLLLRSIQDLIRGIPNIRRNEHVIIGIDTFDAADQHSDVSTITVTALHSMQEKVASAISWLAAALRPSPHAHVTSSSVSIEASNPGPEEIRIDIRLNELEDTPEGQSCWHPLFPHAVIAKGFPIRDRVEGLGLEISFGNMALMSQSVSLVEFDGGLVLEGLRSFLIPKELLPDGSIQWHFEYKRLKHNRKPRRLLEVLSQPHLVKRYRSLEVKDLAQKRCFLGWAEEVEVLIGTEAFSTKTLGWSGATAGQVTGHVKSHGITTGTEGLGIFGFTANRTYLPVSVPSRFILPRNDEILTTLDDERDARTMIYDTGAKTAHVLPRVDVLLFVAHNVLKRRKYDLFDSGHAKTLDFASQNVPALDVLQSSLEFEMVRRGPRRNSATKCFGDLIKELWVSLDIIEEKLVAKEADFATIGKGAPKFLHGVEFRDFERTKFSMSMVQAKVNEPWVHLVISEPTMPVLFCQRLGQPIVPTRPALLCRLWTNVPLGRHYMVATCSAVCSWLERHEDSEDGARLGERVQWRVRQVESKEGLIHRHNSKNSKIVYHEQQLSFAKKAKFHPGIHDLVRNCGRGALIFGSSKRTRNGCSMKLDMSTGPPIPQTSQRHNHHDSNSSILPLPDVPEGRSDTSVETETGSATDHLSSPLSFSVGRLSQESHDALEEDSTSHFIINATSNAPSKIQYMVNSIPEGMCQSESRERASNGGSRSIKKMKKSGQLNTIYRLNIEQEGNTHRGFP